jgi:hypothetical protein
VEDATSKFGDGSFVEALMEQIMTLAMIPKAQIERAIGPILGIFIEDLLSKSDDRLKKICAEFPLRKSPGSYQSTNVDWLLYSSKSEQLVFVELKTTDTTFDLAQTRLHLAAIKKIKENKCSLLINDVEEIEPRSLEQGKYREVLSRIGPYRKCKDARLVYLVPKVMRVAKSGSFDSTDVEWLCFDELPEHVSSHAEAWTVIRKYLVQLDSITRQSRNRRQELPTPAGPAAPPLG